MRMRNGLIQYALFLEYSRRFERPARDYEAASLPGSKHSRLAPQALVAIRRSRTLKALALLGLGRGGQQYPPESALPLLSIRKVHSTRHSCRSMPSLCKRNFYSNYRLVENYTSSRHLRILRVEGLASRPFWVPPSAAGAPRRLRADVRRNLCGIHTLREHLQKSEKTRISIQSSATRATTSS